MDCAVRRVDGSVRLCFEFHNGGCLLWILQLPVRRLRNQLLPASPLQSVQPLRAVGLLDVCRLRPRRVQLRRLCSLQHRLLAVYDGRLFDG